MNYPELFGVRKLKCPKCAHTQMFYVGNYIVRYSFYKEE